MFGKANVTHSMAFLSFAHVLTVSLLMQVELLSVIKHEVKFKIFSPNQFKKKSMASSNEGAQRDHGLTGANCKNMHAVDIDTMA